MVRSFMYVTTKLVLVEGQEEKLQRCILNTISRDTS